MLPRTFFFCGGFGRQEGEWKGRKKEERKGDKINFIIVMLKEKREGELSFGCALSTEGERHFRCVL